MIKILLLINITIVLLSICKCNIKRKYLEINHSVFFSIGFVLYMLLPIFVGAFNLFSESELFQGWHSIYANIKPVYICIYLVAVCSYHLIFNYFSNVRTRKKSVVSQNVSKKFLSERSTLVIFSALLLVVSFFLWRYSKSFFSGYNDLTINMSYKGQFTALTVLYFSFLMLYWVNRMHKKEEQSFVGLLLHPYSIVYYVIAICNLSMGGRLYFISQCFCIVVFYSMYIKKIPIHKMIVVFLCLLMMVLLVGVLRSNGYISIESLFLNLLAEPLFTSYSLVKTLELSEFTIIRLPFALMSYFINLIPTMIFPNKLQYVLSPEQVGITVYSPLGARHLFTSLMMDFGVIGAGLFFYGMARLFSLLQRVTEKTKVIRTTIYILLSGYITFTFFRDGFETSLIKTIFEFSIVFPIAFYIAGLVIEELIYIFMNRNEK